MLPVRDHRLLSRIAVSLYAVAQLCLALAPLGEGRFGADARAHVEAAGTSTHHAHDEAGCAACSARALLSLPNQNGAPVVATGGSAAVDASQIEIGPELLVRTSARPRAPPVRQA
jgi:hypothetical protein